MKKTAKLNQCAMVRVELCALFLKYTEVAATKAAAVVYLEEGSLSSQLAQNLKIEPSNVRRWPKRNGANNKAKARNRSLSYVSCDGDEWFSADEQERRTPSTSSRSGPNREKSATKMQEEWNPGSKTQDPQYQISFQVSSKTQSSRSQNRNRKNSRKRSVANRCPSKGA